MPEDISTWAQELLSAKRYHAVDQGHKEIALTLDEGDRIGETMRDLLDEIEFLTEELRNA